MRTITRRRGLLDAPAARLMTAARCRQARGVTMIEYVIMAAIVIALGIILKDQLGQIFRSMLANLKGFVK